MKAFLSHVYNSVLYQLLIGAGLRFIFGQNLPINWLSFSSIAIIGLFHLVGLQMDFKSYRGEIRLCSLVIVVTTFIPLILFYFACLQFGLDQLAAMAAALVLITTGTGVTIQTLANMNLLETKPGRFLVMVSALDDIPAALLMAVLLLFAPVSPGVITPNLNLLIISAFIFSFILFLWLPRRWRWGLAFISFVFSIASARFLEAYNISPVMAGLLSGILLNLVNREKAQDSGPPLQLLLKPLLPIYIISVGMHLTPSVVTDWWSLSFAFTMVILAGLAKYWGAYLVLRKEESLEPRLISWGLVPRGIPGFAFASAAVAAGLINVRVFTSLILIVTITTWVGLYGLEKTIKRMKSHD